MVWLQVNPLWFMAAQGSWTDPRKWTQEMFTQSWSTPLDLSPESMLVHSHHDTSADITSMHMAQPSIQQDPPRILILQLLSSSAGMMQTYAPT